MVQCFFTDLLCGLGFRVYLFLVIQMGSIKSQEKCEGFS